MKESVSFFISILILSTWIRAQSQESLTQGKYSLTLVNALPGLNNLYVRFGSEKIWPSGSTPGQSTGSVFFPSGKKLVDLSCEGFAKLGWKSSFQPVQILR